MLNDNDISRITKAVRAATSADPRDLRVEDGAILFHTMAGLEKTEAACQALLALGLQHTVDDGEPEYYKSGAVGGIRVDVSWPFDPERPTWNN